MSFFVYLIHNTINNKVYVGKTSAPETRWRKHIEAAFSNRKDHKFYLHRALKKHGADNFVFTVMQRFSNQNEQNAAEKYWIQYFNSRDNKLSSLGWATEELVKFFNVSDKAIRNVVRRISWKHVE
jgi:group I intron endonuclease